MWLLIDSRAKHILISDEPHELREFRVDFIVNKKLNCYFFFKESIAYARNQGHEYLHIKKLIDRSKKFAYEQMLQHFKNTMSTIPRGVIDCNKKIGKAHNL